MRENHVPFECECGHQLNDHRETKRCMVHGCICENYAARVAFRPQAGETGPRSQKQSPRAPEQESET